jgi:hypothetical protein
MQYSHRELVGSAEKRSERKALRGCTSKTQHTQGFFKNSKFALRLTASITLLKREKE